jgi:hypothetical protein
MLNIIGNIIITVNQGGGGAILPIANNVVVSQDTNTVSVTFDINSLIEDNLPPTIEDVYLTGTFLVGNSITAVIRDFFSRSGYPAGSHIYKFYTASDSKGTSETLVQNSTSPNYTLLVGDNGKYIRCEVTAVQTGGLNTQSDIPVSSLYTLVSSSVFDPYIDIPFAVAMKWFTTTDTNNYANGTPKDGNATTTTVPPTFDGTKNSNRFTRSTNSSAVSNGYKILATTGYVAPLEQYLEFITPTAFAGTQAICSLSGTHQIQISSTGLLSISGTSTGVTLATNTRYVLYLLLNGASSVYSLNYGGDTAISLSTAAIGTPNIRLGSQFADTNYWDGWITRYFVMRSRALTGTEKTKMQTYFGF